MDHHNRSSTFFNVHCNPNPPISTSTTSSHPPSEALASHPRESLAGHGLDPLEFTRIPQRNNAWDLPIDKVTKSRKRSSTTASLRGPHIDDGIRELKENIHGLLSVPLGFGGHATDRWGSTVPSPSHSRHYSVECDTESFNADKTKKYSGSKSYKSVRRGGSVDGRFFRLNSILGICNPIPCDFRKSPALLKTSDGRAAKLKEPALIRNNQRIRMRQMTLVFSGWDWEIVVSTPATLFPDNSSPANVQIITSLDILDCTYLHLSEPVLKDTTEWNSASGTERNIARQSLAARGGKTVRRIDWLGGKTMFGGLEYVGGATHSQGAGADGGRWVVSFK